MQSTQADICTVQVVGPNDKARILAIGHIADSLYSSGYRGFVLKNGNLDESCLRLSVSGGSTDHNLRITEAALSTIKTLKL